MKLHLKTSLTILFSVLILSFIIAILKGSVDILAKDLLLKESRTILVLRILRVFTAIVVGSGLSVSGIVLQSIMKNPLADPYLLGTSSGAGVGAVIATVLCISSIYLPFAAFIGAIISVIIVYSLAKQNNKINTQSLILSGVIVSIALSAITVFIISTSGSETLHSVSWWLWGSLQVYDFGLLAVVTAIVLTGVISVYIFSQDLNALSLGDEDAVHLGVDADKVKRILIIIVSLIVSSIVCVSGTIGFVGLIIPHLMRFIVGPNHRILIPTSCIAASIFMVICDLLSRIIMPPLEIPIGVITAVLGAPVFIILLRKSQTVR
ncbi:MAG: iron ABC transporter permease [Candidatus Omnitrophica bacterium]|nr:iron ABC transporter permease [Candidatus Omnitrophota bacterium]